MTPKKICFDISQPAGDLSLESLFTNQLEKMGDAASVVLSATPTATSRERAWWAHLPVISWAWERKLFKEAGIGIWHRVRTAAHVHCFHSLPTLTTIVPGGTLQRFPSLSNDNHLFAVPSKKDAASLKTGLGATADRVHVVPSVARSRYRFPELNRVHEPNEILAIVGDHKYFPQWQKWLAFTQELFPKLSMVSMNKSAALTLCPEAWKTALSRSALVLYLDESPFDWPVLALEAMDAGVPTLFAEGNHALSEALPTSPLGLKRVLLSRSPLNKLASWSQEARSALKESGNLDAQTELAAYSDLYAILSTMVDEKDLGETLFASPPTDIMQPT